MVEGEASVTASDGSLSRDGAFKKEVAENCLEPGSLDGTQETSPSNNETPRGSAQRQSLQLENDGSGFPDGGLNAWLCVAGAAASSFCAFGWITCFPRVLRTRAYYARGPLKQYSTIDIGWIVSVEVFCMLFGAPFAGMLFDHYGPRWLLLTGTVLHVFGLMMASLCHEYYQFMLSQSICSAVGASLIFNPTLASVSTWFHNRRDAALGLTFAGTSVGGVVFPIMITKLLPQVGFRWTMRICSFLILALMTFANLTIRSRIQPLKRPVRWIHFVRPWGELKFALVATAMFLFNWGMFLPSIFIAVDARRHNMAISSSHYLVSILNAGAFFGRVIPGFIGDRYGRANTMIGASFLTALFILAFWIPASSASAFYVYAVVIGMATGAGISLPPAIVAQISQIEEIGVRNGAAYGVAAFATLTGPPIGAALISHANGNLMQMKIFAGAACFASCLIFIWARIAIGGARVRVVV